MFRFQNIAQSFSGGRTSAVMTKRVWDAYHKTHRIINTFANTGLEHPATLDFVFDFEKHTGIPVVWLEAVVSPNHGTGITHKVVNYETASRNGEPFEAYIAKHGIPNQTAPQCTTKLKTCVMESYLKTQGFLRGKKLNYETCIGIRADEMDRMSATAQAQGLVYPLIKWGYTKPMVLREMAKFDWDLAIPDEHYGNCVTCWKKSDRKLMTLAVEAPSSFDFFRRMEKKYRYFKADTAAGGDAKDRLFFRKHRTVDDIFEAAKSPFKMFRSSKEMFEPLDYGESCGESCEAYK